MVDDSLLSPCIVNWLIVAGEVIVEVVSRAGVGIPALAATRVEDIVAGEVIVEVVSRAGVGISALAGEVIVEVVSRAGMGIPALATTRVEDNLVNGPVESAKGEGGDATVESHDSRGT